MTWGRLSPPPPAPSRYQKLPVTIARMRDDIERALDEVAASCDRHRYFNEHRTRYRLTLKRFLRHIEGTRILDVGAAPGHLARALSLLGYEVHCIVHDLNENWENTPVREFQFADQALSTGLRLVQCDIQNEPFPLEAGVFDAVLFTEVLEHLWLFPLEPLSEIARVTRTGGHLILTTPNATAIKARLRWVRGVTTFPALEEMVSLPVHMRHTHEYTRREVEELVRRAGFEVVESDEEDAYRWVTRRSDGTYEDSFKLNSLHQAGKVILSGLNVLMPSSRSGLAVVGRKQ
jgi:SAM-dependent methyltransferase